MLKFSLQNLIKENFKMKWTEGYKIKFHDTDANEILSPKNTLKLMQETAMLQMKGVGTSYEELFNQKKAFILSTIRLEFISPIFAYDEVEVDTWAHEGKGFTFPRFFEIRRDGETVAEGASSWALVHTEEKRLISQSEIDLSHFPCDEPLKTEHSQRIRIPSALPLSLVGEYTVRYSDIDLNGHMNNTNYPGVICDYLPSIDKIRITSMGISFLNEAKYGEVLKVYLGRVDSKYFFRTVREDGKTNIEAEIIFESI
jgi:acyl-CoA thioesterase FadM